LFINWLLNLFVFPEKHDKKQYDTEDPAVAPDPVVGDMEPDHVENTNNEGRC